MYGPPPQVWSAPLALRAMLLTCFSLQPPSPLGTTGPFSGPVNLFTFSFIILILFQISHTREIIRYLSVFV